MTQNNNCILFNLQDLTYAILIYDNEDNQYNITNNNIIEYIRSFGFKGEISNININTNLSLFQSDESVIIFISFPYNYLDKDDILNMNDIFIYEYNSNRELMKSYNIKDTKCKCINKHYIKYYKVYIDDYIDAYDSYTYIPYGRSVYVLKDLRIYMKVDLSSYENIDIMKDINTFIAYNIDIILNESLIDTSSNEDSINNDWYQQQMWELVELGVVDDKERYL